MTPFAVSAGERPLTVFAAASLTDAMTEIGKAFTEATGQPVIFSFASTSTLARQIEAGAPADVFAAANRAWADYLVDRGYLDKSSLQLPMTNRLVLVAPLGSLEKDAAKDYADYLRDMPKSARLAVGDPDHVPAGLYAKQAIRSAGLWELLEPRLARADNVRGALALVSRGEAPFAIVYATDADLTDDVFILAEIPASFHDPIAYVFGLVMNGPGSPDNAKASEFLNFVNGEVARAIFRRNGFVMGDQS